jgi:hypothetical protein
MGRRKSCYWMKLLLLSVSYQSGIPLMIDLETDAKIQATIHTEFEGKTLLCIAHRLRTIISWDRILVMNAGEIEVCSDGCFRADFIGI